MFVDIKDEKEESKKELLLKEILEQEKLILEKIQPETEPAAGNEDGQLDTSHTTQDDATGDAPIQTPRQGTSREMSEVAQLDTPQAVAQATRPEATRDATRDTGTVASTTESGITPATGSEATGSEATGGVVSGGEIISDTRETTPLLIQVYTQD